MNAFFAHGQSHAHYFLGQSFNLIICICLLVRIVISKLLRGLEQSANDLHILDAGSFLPKNDNADSPKGQQAYPASLKRYTQQASDAYVMRYADVNALLCAAA